MIKYTGRPFNEKHIKYRRINIGRKQEALSNTAQLGTQGRQQVCGFRIVRLAL